MLEDAKEPSPKVKRMVQELERLTEEEGVKFPMDQETAWKYTIRAAYNSGYNDAMSDLLGISDSDG